MDPKIVESLDIREFLPYAGLVPGVCCICRKSKGCASRSPDGKMLCLNCAEDLAGFCAGRDAPKVEKAQQCQVCNRNQATVLLGGKAVCSQCAGLAISDMAKYRGQLF